MAKAAKSVPDGYHTITPQLTLDDAAGTIEWYKKALSEKGMKIMPPSPKLMADMRQVGAIMLADWEKRAGPDGQAVVAAFRKN